MMWTYERVMWGPLTKAVNATIADLTARELAVMVPLMGLILLLGLYPAPLLTRMQPAVAELLDRVHAAEAIEPQTERHQLARRPFAPGRFDPSKQTITRIIAK